MPFDVTHLRLDAVTFHTWADSANRRSLEHRNVAQWNLTQAAARLSQAAARLSEAATEYAHALNAAADEMEETR